MEDTHLAVVLQHDGEELGLFAVFDGHGGSQVSAAIPTMLVEKLSFRLASSGNDGAAARQDLSQVLTETLEDVDTALFDGPLGIGRWLSPAWLHPFGTIGSTACIAVVDSSRRKIVVANAGDSRAIVCRRGTAVPLSMDHKPEDPVEFARISRAGGRVVRMGPCYRIDGGLNLSRALGDYRYKANTSLPTSEQKVVATPTIAVHDWEPEDGDEFLIVACDGLFERMTRQGVVSFVRDGLSKGQSQQEVLQGLLRECCAPSPHELGQDNETAILVQWTRVGEDRVNNG